MHFFGNPDVTTSRHYKSKEKDLQCLLYYSYIIFFIIKFPGVSRNFKVDSNFPRVDSARQWFSHVDSAYYTQMTVLNSTMTFEKVDSAIAMRYGLRTPLNSSIPLSISQMQCNFFAHNTYFLQPNLVLVRNVCLWLHRGQHICCIKNKKWKY